MSNFFRLVSLLKSSETIKATLRKTMAAFQNVQSSVAAMETAAVQDLVNKAEHGAVTAQYDCGEQYYFGSSVPQDYSEAAKWFRRAAEQGHAQAQSNLGMMCALGRGMERDCIEAFKWVSLAAAQGNKGALKSQNTLLKRMTPEQIAEGRRRAAEFVAQPRPKSAVTPSPQQK